MFFVQSEVKLKPTASHSRAGVSSRLASATIQNSTSSKLYFLNGADTEDGTLEKLTLLIWWYLHQFKLNNSLGPFISFRRLVKLSNLKVDQLIPRAFRPRVILDSNE